MLGMWADYDREGLPGILRWAAEDAVWRPHSSSASSPDLARLLADVGLPGRANEAYIAMHGTEDVA